MKLSLQEIKQLNSIKDSFIEPEVSKAIVRYTPKPQQPDRSGQCYKHGALHNQCASIGIRRTKAKRWRETGGLFASQGAFISDGELNRIEEIYQAARVAFHKEPCTCKMI